MSRVLSGIQPTNKLTVGNYLGAIKNWVAMQDEHECLFCVVDLHAITVPHDPAQLAQNTREVAAAYIASGIDAERHALFVQSVVPEHAELAWILGCMTPMGWLNRMTQFKEKAGKKKEQAGLGLYAYPVLMAADILLYDATHVPVGDDQKQHVELAREIVASVNHRFGAGLLTMPEPIIMGAATRVMSLRDGTKKMSKSDESDYSRINLTDSADEIALKIRKAKTDSDPLPAHVEGLENRPEARNLVTIYAALAERSIAEVLAEYEGKGFGVFKPALADLCVEKIGPISHKIHELTADPAELDAILKRGAEQARSIATPTACRIKQAMGFWAG